MAPVAALARARRRSRSAVAIGAVAVVLAAAGCARDEPVDATAATTVPVVATDPGTTMGSVPATGTSAPPPSAAVTSVVPTTAAPAPTTTAAPKGTSAGVLRGLATTSTVSTFVDPSRPTISHGGTVAPSRTLTTTIVRPASGGPYPLIVFAHGYQLGPSSYQHLIGVLAAAGYVVAAPSFPLADASVAGGNLDRGDIPNQSGDLRFVIDQLLAGPLAGSIDRNRIGAVGHSDGADTVLDLGYHPQRLDTRVRAVAALSPDAMTSAAVGGAPLLISHGDHDTIVPYRNATTVFGQVPAHRFLLTLVGADHLPPVQGVQPWARVLEAAVLDLLDARVAGRTAGDGTLTTDASVAGVATIKGAG